MFCAVNFTPSCLYSSVSLQETYEAKRNEFMGELQKKEEEMRQMFVQRVKEKEAELKEAEKEVMNLNMMCATLKDISTLV